MTLDVDIRFRQGDFQLKTRFAAPDGVTVLFGPSGGGKSTLLSAIAGLKPCLGHIRLGGRALCDTRHHVPPHLRGIGLVFQDARLFPHLTVRGNIEYAWRRAPQASRLSIAEVAGFFDIAALLDRGVGNLSGGEKSRVALARALVSRPDFLLLDEPFAALDATRRHSFVDVLLAMHRTYRLPMMVVTHDVEDAAALGSHLVALQDGHVVVSGQFIEASGTTEFQDLLDSRDTGAAIPASALRSRREQVQSIWLRADHVLVSTEFPHAISARNILAGIVRSVQADACGSHVVQLETQSGPLLSRMTSESIQELGIAHGRNVWALIKAHAL